MAERTCSYRAAACFHMLVALLSLGGGITLFVLGFKLSSLPSDATPADIFSFLSGGTIMKLLGVTLVLYGLASCLAARQRCIGVTFRVFYLVLALAFIVLLGIVFVTSLIGISRLDTKQLHEGMLFGWKNMTKGSSVVDNVCSLEFGMKCRGFDDGDCVGCKPGNMTSCHVPEHCVDCSKSELAKSEKAPDPKHGCFRAQVAMIRSAGTISVAISAVLLLVIVMDVFVSCRFPVHVADLVLRGDPDEEGEIPEEDMSVTG